MNSVVMSIRGLPSLELWVLTLPVVPVSSGRNQMVLGGSGGSGGSGDFEIVGFDWSYQSRIRKWYFVNLLLQGVPNLILRVYQAVLLKGPHLQDWEFRNWCHDMRVVEYR